MPPPFRLRCGALRPSTPPRGTARAAPHDATKTRLHIAATRHAPRLRRSCWRRRYGATARGCYSACALSSGTASCRCAPHVTRAPPVWWCVGGRGGAAMRALCRPKRRPTDGLNEPRTASVCGRSGGGGAGLQANKTISAAG
eukprot:56540-Chlamydomonas_euryale.AAC.1